MQTVARVCATFHLDPLAVLASTDPFELSVRIAAAKVVQEDERKSQEASRRGGGRVAGRRR